MQGKGVSHIKICLHSFQRSAWAFSKFELLSLIRMETVWMQHCFYSSLYNAVFVLGTASVLEEQFEPGSHLHTHFIFFFPSRMWLKTVLYVWLICFCKSKSIKRWKKIRPSAGLGPLIDRFDFCEIKLGDTIRQWPLCPVSHIELQTASAVSF